MRVLMPGSYDPCTRGHIALIERAVATYGEVTVAVFINPEKQGLFTYGERVRLLCLATAHLPSVDVAFSDGMVADYAKAGGYAAIVKGIRNEKDRAYEETMAAYNKERSGVPTVLLTADDGYGHISSTAVREALATGGDLSALLPAAILSEVRALYKKKAKKCPSPCGTDQDVL